MIAYTATTNKKTAKEIHPSLGDMPFHIILVDKEGKAIISQESIDAITQQVIKAIKGEE